MDVTFLITCIKVAVKYVPITLYLGLTSFFIGLIFGIIIALVRFFKVQFISTFFKWTISLSNSIPLLLTLTVFYLVVSDALHPLGNIVGANWQFKFFDRKWIAIFALSIFSTNYVAEAIRSALNAVPQSQWDAAYSVGLTTKQTLFGIIMPQALRSSIPLFGNILTSLIKGSSLVSAVSVVDLLNSVMIKAQVNYEYFEAYLAAAIVYWVLCTVITFASRFLGIISSKQRRIFSD
ncbi:amino acid ABC transporter [Liquorilactobacillus sucicola DSM 21376 = JCM 15457]|uniref:L-cystine permease n=1 Tax=Liquorilactobacillus sucicola DSM 21376 = JCM 15457 TaxID=1423806 RepID=A0A023CYA7_9LACO|nr:ABC transporter permease subunit [Liquorilactobacillus sucicola]KRN07505.1 L-cystine permease [Liquorilactobacillus sucicola DSM 21376 = JCM 15457]GAJ26867.1 amino acid ABC transporter [Liquorilactobacillus sucicola DSM 21376 = JCM 15457]